MVKTIRNDADYIAALKELEVFFRTMPDEDTEEGIRFDQLLTMVEDWEIDNHLKDS